MTGSPGVPKKSNLKVGISSYLGTTIEYYDFLLYGSAAALVFNQVFFSNTSAMLGTILSLLTFAAGYLARFVGAVVFGHFGDRLGRKSVMLTTLVIMGLSSGLMGVLPTYAQVGALAPILLLLLRLIQGLAVGGEFGGAVLMASEHAGASRRGLAASAATIGGPSGALLATGAMLLVSRLPQDDMLSWGWRIPFLASFVLLAVALYFRLSIDESPEFASAESSGGKAPLMKLVRESPAKFVLAVLFQVGPFAAQGIVAVFLVSYAKQVGFAPSDALLAVMVATAGAVLTTPIISHLSDKWGRLPFIYFGVVGTILYIVPFFAIVNLGNTALLVVAVTIYMAVILPGIAGVGAVFLTELFDTQVRYTGVSVSYQLAQTLGVGIAPAIAASLLSAAGGGTNTYLISLYVIVVSVVSLVAVVVLQRIRNRGAGRASSDMATPRDTTVVTTVTSDRV